MSRLALSLSLSLALGACTGRDAGTNESDAGAAPDAGHDASAPDAGGDASASDPRGDAGGDAGACELDCAPLPEECHYEGRDCAKGLCGEIVCPDPERLCGGLFHGFCRSDEYCDFAIAGACGTLDEVGYCRPRPTECSGGSGEVCGCDYTTYASACEAHRAGRDVVRDGPCPPPDPCRGHDAWSDEGPCRDELGWKWTGARCEPIVGCACTGSDCAAIHSDQATCERESAECIEALCDALDARAVRGGCEESSLGWTWDGTACVELSGCECEGTECFRLEGTAEACATSWAGCGA